MRVARPHLFPRVRRKENVGLKRKEKQHDYHVDDIARSFALRAAHDVWRVTRWSLVIVICVLSFGEKKAACFLSECDRLFGCDAAAGLAGNREQERGAGVQTGV